jgi:hypothetical protein
MGQGVLQDVSGRLVETFAKNLAAMLEGKQAEPAPAAAATSTEPAAPPPPQAEPAPEQEDALDLGSLGGAMAADKLSDPRNLGLIIGLAMLIAYLLGRRSAR